MNAFLRLMTLPLRRRATRRKQRVLDLTKALLSDQRFVAVDVGAAAGVLSHWKALDGVATVYQIEPRKDACEELRAINARNSSGHLYHVLQAAVSGSGGTRTLYVSNSPTGSSLFAPDVGATDWGEYVDQSYFFPLVEVPIETETLEGLLVSRKEQQVDLIKLDIQGAELEAVLGLGDTRLNNLLGVELEVGLHKIYPQAGQFSDVDRTLDEIGLELFDIRAARTYLPHQGDAGYYQRQVFQACLDSPTIAARLWEMDAVYFRKKSLVLAEGDPAKVRRLMICYATYNFFAEAHSLAEDAGRRGLIDTGESRELMQLVVDLHHAREMRPWLADKEPYNSLRRWGQRLSPRNGPRWCQYTYQRYPNA